MTKEEFDLLLRKTENEEFSLETLLEIAKAPKELKRTPDFIEWLADHRGDLIPQIDKFMAARIYEMRDGPDGEWRKVSYNQWLVGKREGTHRWRLDDTNQEAENG